MFPLGVSVRTAETLEVVMTQHVLSEVRVAKLYKASAVLRTFFYVFQRRTPLSLFFTE